MGLLRFFPRMRLREFPSTALSTLGPTPQATPEMTPTSTPGSTLVLAPEPTPEPDPAAVYIVRDAGIVVDLVRGAVPAIAHPEAHALNLLRCLMDDSDFAGQPATEKAIRKYYLSACRLEGMRPFPWHSVLRAPASQSDTKSDLRYRVQEELPKRVRRWSPSKAPCVPNPLINELEGWTAWRKLSLRSPSGRQL